MTYGVSTRASRRTCSPNSGSRFRSAFELAPAAGTSIIPTAAYERDLGPPGTSS
jgi:hypothetical protein